MSDNIELQELMYHRSLYSFFTQPPQLPTLPHRAYWLTGGSVKKYDALLKPDQEFWKYTTSWERAWSNLAFPGLRADPLLDEQGLVVGHVGWFREDVIWLAPANQGSVQSVGRWDFEALVASQNPRPGYFHLANPGSTFDLSYLLVTDIGGRVSAALDSHNSDAIESSSVTPLDLLLVPKLVVSLTGSLAGKIVPTITSKLAKPAMSNGLRELTSAELGAYNRVRELARKDLTHLTAGKPEPFLSDGLAHIWGRGPPDPTLRLATHYMTSSKFQVHFNAVERRLLDLERNLPENLREVTRSYNRIPLQFRQSITADLQQHIKLVVDVMELRSRRTPNSFNDIIQHIDGVRDGL